MSEGSLAVFLACAFGAEVIGTMAGFGAATVLTPIASWFLDIKTAVAVVACCHLAGGVSRAVLFRRALAWDIVVRFGVPGVLCAFLGAQAAAWLPASAIRAALGGFLLLYVALEMARVTAMSLPQTTATLLGGGILSGFVAGLIGTGGAIRSVCLLAFGLPKDTYLATSAAIAVAVDATRLPVYVNRQLLPASLVPLILGLTGVAFAGAWVGRRLVRRISPVHFKYFVLLLLALMGLKLMVDGLRGMA